MTVGQTFFGARGARIGMALGAALGCVATAGAFDAGGGDMGMGGDMFGGGDVFSGDAFGGDMFGGGDVFSGDAFGGDMFGGGDVFSGDAFDGDMFSADSFGGDLGMDGAGWGLEGFGEEGGLLQDSWFADLGGSDLDLGSGDPWADAWGPGTADESSWFEVGSYLEGSGSDGSDLLLEGSVSETSAVFGQGAWGEDAPATRNPVQALLDSGPDPAMMAALRDGLPTQEGQVLIADASTDKDWIAATLQQNAQNAGGQAGTSSTPLVGPKVKPLSEIFGWGKKTEPNATGTSTTSEQKPLWEHPWVKTGGEWIQKGLVKIGVKADKRAEFFNSNGQGLANGMNQVSAYPDQVSGK